MDDVEIFIRLTWSFHHDFHFQIASGRTIRLLSWGKAGFTLKHIKSAGEIRELIFKKVELQSDFSSFWVFNVWICTCYMVKVLKIPRLYPESVTQITLTWMIMIQSKDSILDLLAA